jgi:hypothetical protein
LDRDRIGVPCRPIGQQEGIGVHRPSQIVLALLPYPCPRGRTTVSSAKRVPTK